MRVVSRHPGTAQGAGRTKTSDGASAETGELRNEGHVARWLFHRDVQERISGVC